MTESAEQLIDQALQLKAAERASVAERMLLSLNTPSAEIDAVWANEADARIEAFNRDEIRSTPAEHVFAKYLK